MAIDGNYNDSFFQNYRNSGPSIALIGPAILLNIIGMPGVLMNAFVIFTTISNRTLRGSANFLMTLISFFEFIHQFCHLIFLGIVASGINFIEMRTAAFILMPQIFSLVANLISIFCAALDRLIAVAAIDWHSKMYANTKRRRAYLAGLTIFIGIYAAFGTEIAVTYGIQNAGIPTTGYLGEVLPPIGFNWYLASCIPLVGSILCYCLIGCKVRMDKNVTNETNSRLLHSLILIMTINLGCYLFGLSACMILLNFDFGLDPISLWELSFLPALILNIGAAANAPILYMNSTEYRKAFKKEIKWMFPKMFKMLKMQNTTSIQPMNNNNNSINVQPASNSNLFLLKVPTNQTAKKQQRKIESAKIGRRKLSVWSTDN